MPIDLAHLVLSDVSLWDTDLTLLPGFADAVKGYMMEPVFTGTSTL